MNSRALGLGLLVASRQARDVYVGGVTKRFKQARKMTERRRAARRLMQAESRWRNR